MVVVDSLQGARLLRPSQLPGQPRRVHLAHVDEDAQLLRQLRQLAPHLGGAPAPGRRPAAALLLLLLQLQLVRGLLQGDHARLAAQEVGVQR